MTTTELIERVKGNPKTSALGLVTGALYAAGDYLHSAGVEPFGALILGAAGLIGTIALLLARDGAPKDPPQ